MILITSLLHTTGRAWRRIRKLYLRPLFGKHGTNFIFDPDGYYSFRNIFVGNDVNLGVRPILIAALSEIRIGSHVMLGPEVVIVGGGHNIYMPGHFMTHVHEKTGNENLGVEIGNDVWIGTRAVILRGVNIGRRVVVGAGSVVIKSVPPYGIVAGNPACIVKFRWDVETIINHEQLLYPPKKRLHKMDLEEWQNSIKMLPPRRIASSE